MAMKANEKGVPHPAEPKRHLKARTFLKPKTVHLPVELLEQIAAELDVKSRLRNLGSLRLVCRSFGNGLLNSITSGWDLDVYLDDDGMGRLDLISKSIYAPYIRKINVGIRKLANEAIVFEPDVESNALRFYPSERIDKITTKRFIKSLDMVFKTPRSAHWLDSMRKTAYDEVGMKSARTDLGCKVHPSTDHNYTPTDMVLARFKQCLDRLLNLEVLSSREAIRHQMVTVKDKDRKEILRRPLKRQIGAFLEKAHCECPRWQEDDEGYPTGKVCKSTSSMARFFIFDFARFAQMLDPGPSHLYASLKEIKLDFPNTKFTQCNSRAKEWLHISQMLRQCKELQVLHLWTVEPDKAHTANAAITSIVDQLTFKCAFKLKDLRLSSVDPAAREIVDFLQKQPELKLLWFKNCTHWEKDNSKADMREFCNVLKAMPDLKLQLERSDKSSSRIGPGFSIFWDRDAMDLPTYLDQVLEALKPGA